MKAWEWVILQRLSDIEIRQITIFTDFIPLHFCRFFADFLPLNVDLVNFSVSNVLGLQTRPSVLLQVYRARIVSVNQTGLNHGSHDGET